MYLVKRQVCSNYGNFREGNHTLKGVPDSVRRGWEAQGLIERITLPTLTPDPSSQEDPQSDTKRSVDEGLLSGESKTYGKRKRS